MCQKVSIFAQKVYWLKKIYMCTYAVSIIVEKPFYYCTHPNTPPPGHVLNKIVFLREWEQANLHVVVWTEPPSIWWWHCVLGLMWFRIAHKDKAAFLRVQKSEIVLEYVQTEALECRLARDRAFWASRRQCLDLGQLKSKRCACLDTKLRLLLRQEKSERYASLNDKLM